jgi:hypothetical protein
VILWPEKGCYQEKDSVNKQKNMTNLQRYAMVLCAKLFGMEFAHFYNCFLLMYRFLTQLTSHQFCLMSKEDLESFSWKSSQNNLKKPGHRKRITDFRVTLEQEQQRSVEIEDGFKV